MTPAERVRAENEAFRKALPDLMTRLGGRWVVFRDGDVDSDHATSRDAYQAAVAKFGARSGFLVAEVKEVKPTPLTAGVLFVGAP